MCKKKTFSVDTPGQSLGFSNSLLSYLQILKKTFEEITHSIRLGQCLRAQFDSCDEMTVTRLYRWDQRRGPLTYPLTRQFLPRLGQESVKRVYHKRHLKLHV